MRLAHAVPFPLRMLLCIAAIPAAGMGCSSKRASPRGAPDAAPPSLVSPSRAGTPGTSDEPPSPRQGQIAGLRYIEQMTGGARPEQPVPMIVALHPMGGDPAELGQLFSHYRRRARLILPYGHPSGGLYIWYDSVRGDVAAPIVRREVDRIVAALAALVVARPTVGKPLVTGFSQGGIMAFALAVLHPDAVAAAFPISGLLPPSIYPSSALSSLPRPATLPPIVAFHGAADLAVPTVSARASIAELRRAGYHAALREYAAVEHDISPQEEAEILEQIGRTADALAAAEPAPTP
ncbi:MAG TPA: dienelactone hydrolase family protein [Pseudomonadota bacterium]|nr:dienelactone hydrolase family protein [Pseudomonadota bacterium]